MNTVSTRMAALVALLALALLLPQVSGGAGPEQLARTPTATAIGEPINSNGPGAVVATNSPLPANATAPAGESAQATPTSPLTPRPDASAPPASDGGSSLVPTAQPSTAVPLPSDATVATTSATDATATSATSSATTSTTTITTTTNDSPRPYPAAGQQSLPEFSPSATPTLSPTPMPSPTVKPNPTPTAQPAQASALRVVPAACGPDCQRVYLPLILRLR